MPLAPTPQLRLRRPGLASGGSGTTWHPGTEQDDAGGRSERLSLDRVAVNRLGLNFRVGVTGTLEIAEAGRAAKDRSRVARPHPPDEQRESKVGSVSDPWRAVNAWL